MDDNTEKSTAAIIQTSTPNQEIVTPEIPIVIDTVDGVERTNTNVSTSQEYGASQIRKLEGLEAVRERPGMYIGEPNERGLHHCIFEVLDNSIDEYMAGYGKEINVTIHNNGSCSIEDFGRGIPIDWKEEDKMHCIELVLTKLHAGGKFGQGAYEFSGGLHGVGAKCVNAVSDFFKAEVFKEGKVHTMEFSKGKVTKTLSVEREIDDKTRRGTRISFIPDPTIFKETVTFKFDRVHQRLNEFAFLNPGLKLILKDERDGNEAISLFPKGIVEFIHILSQNKEKIHPEPIIVSKFKDGMFVDAVLQYTDSYNEQIIYFANSIANADGGQHATGFKSALTRAINTYAKQNNLIKDKEPAITGDDVREGLICILSVKLKEPKFSSQTKEKLISEGVEPIVGSVVFECISDYFDRNPAVAKRIIERSLMAARGREAARRARETVRKSAMIGGGLPGKLSDCSEDDANLCELYIVEGNGAAGCWSPSTRITLSDGRNLNFLELIEEQSRGIQNYGYTTLENGEIAIRPLKNIRMTKSNASVIRVTLDSGAEEICTPDHLFRLADGSYKVAELLTPEDSIMPLNRRISKKGEDTLDGYEMLWCSVENMWKYTHRVSEQYNLLTKKYDISIGYIVHHVSFNKLNNNPDLLQRVTHPEHMRIHHANAEKTLHRPDVIAKRNASCRTPEHRKMLSERSKKQWKNEYYKTWMVGKWRTFYDSNEEYRIANKAQLDKGREYWNDEANKEKQSKRTTEYFEKHPEHRENFSKASKKQWKNEELVEWRKEETKKQWTDEFRAKRTAAYNETYKKHTMSMAKECFIDNEFSEAKFEETRKAKASKNVLKFETLVERFFDKDKVLAVEAIRNYNHKVVKIEHLAEKMDVYDLEVEETHNYALASGIFVHNSAKQGRDSKHQAILPLKGKIINVEKARLDKVLQNGEVLTLIKAVGTGIGSGEGDGAFDISKLRYAKIIIMTDADVDGSHIRTLILTFFYRHMKELMVNGNIYIAQPPLYQIKRKKREEYVLNNDELDKILLELGLSEVELLKPDESVVPKEYLNDLLETLNKIGRIEDSIRSSGGSFVEYLKARKDGHLPTYLVIVRQGNDEFPHYFYNETQVREFALQNPDLNLFEVNEAVKSNRRGRLIELSETVVLLKLEENLKNKGLKLEQYIPDGEATFVLKDGDRMIKIDGLNEIINAIKTAGERGTEIKRFKGLGEMNPDQLYETTMRADTRKLLRVKLNDENATVAEKMFTVLMGDIVEPRRQFIEDNVLNVKNLDI